MENLGPLMNNEDYPDKTKGGALDQKIKKTEQPADGTSSRNQPTSIPSDSDG